VIILIPLVESHNKSDKYTDEEYAELERLERERLVNPGHNHGTATGVAAGTAMGTGAYETSRHHGTAPGEHDPSTAGYKPEGTDIGDKLHGVERNRGVNGSSGFPDSEGFGDREGHYTGSGHGPNIATDSEGRNRLHKDPPASHPAAHATHGGAGTGSGTLGGNSGGNTY
jgi:hypothetical protein